MGSLKGRDFLKLLDFTPEEIKQLLSVAIGLKKKKHANESHRYLEGKQIAIIFEKDSTRTRCSFEVAARDLGMGVTYLGPTGSQMGKKETIADTARVLASMYDGIEYRGFEQSIVQELADYSKVPVWNGLTNEFHPTQMLADVMTILDEFGEIKGKKLVFCGDARNNVGNSLMVVSAKLGMNFTCCAPRELFPEERLVEECQRICNETGGSVTLTEDIMEGTENADAIYTDVWVSMGEPMELWEQRINLLRPYQVNSEVMANANPNAIFLHCLPSFHNTGTSIGKDIFEKFGLKEMEVTDEVFESKQSRVFEEAENRMHTIKAVMLETLR
ncbi:MAG: ornithine carbamoyltransferase [Lachnospiraceae bacterium]|nr:ornithine carbamoyltransferase [Lachnospiraceae bacterium]